MENRAEVVRTEPVYARSSLHRSKDGPGNKLIAPVKVEGFIRDANHARNFLGCLKSRKLCNCDIETGPRSTTATLLGNITLRTKSYVQWDAVNEKITNHPELA